MSRPTFTGSYQFMTTKPATRKMSKASKEWLYVLPLQDMTAANLYYKMYFDDGTNSTSSISLGNLRDDEVKIVEISYALEDYDSNISSPATRISKMEMYVGTASTEDSGDKLTYIPYTPKGTTLDVYYFNSYGGLDSLICEGETSESIASSQTITRRSMTHSEDLNETAQYKAVDASGRRRFAINTAFMPLKEVKALRDIAIKKGLRVMEVINGTNVLLPCQLENNTLSLPGSHTPNTNTSLTISYAWDDESLDRQE